METKLYDTWILSEVELNICVRSLGYSDWYHIEIEDNGEALESRLLKGFFSLVEKGMLCSQEDHFEPTVLMKKLIGPICEPERMIIAKIKGKDYVYFQKAGENLLGIEELQTERRYFRLFSISEEEAGILLKEADIQIIRAEEKDDIN